MSALYSFKTGKDPQGSRNGSRLLYLNVAVSIELTRCTNVSQHPVASDVPMSPRCCENGDRRALALPFLAFFYAHGDPGLARASCGVVDPGVIELPGLQEEKIRPREDSTDGQYGDAWQRTVALPVPAGGRDLLRSNFTRISCPR